MASGPGYIPPIKEPLELSKREYFAAMAMQGLAAKGVPPNWHESHVRKSWVEWVSEMSCELADELIKELNKTQ